MVGVSHQPSERLVPDLLVDIPTQKFFNGILADVRENESINLE
jgi:hypothetical protein